MRSYSHRLDRQARLTAIAIAAGTSVLFAVACCLEPNIHGHGTHQQLGLPECQFLGLIGLKCSQCGITTSFAHIVRGQAFQAWRANPCGPLLTVVPAVIVFPWSVIAGFTGRSMLTRSPGFVSFCMAGCYLLIATGVWLIRSAIL